MPDISIDQDTCIGCGACAALCTGQVFERREHAIAVTNPSGCIACGHCVAACPVDAIAHERLSLKDCPTVDTLPELSVLVNIFRARRSIRIYKNQAVPRETIRQLIDIARWAPSASNTQQVDWLVFDDPTRIKALSDQIVALFGRAARWLRFPLLKPLWTLVLGRRAKNLERWARTMEQQHMQGQDPILFGAPVLLVAHTRKGAPFSRDDAIYAAYNLMLAAQQMGLGACQIGFFMVALGFSRKLGQMLGLPKHRRAQVVLVLGYGRYPFRRALPRRQPEITWNTERIG
ncbi:MAG: nitroreductase family protein [Anaerolineae bacterium]|nr:nitroreductase family protein [Anaerolineae bacterium]